MVTWGMGVVTKKKRLVLRTTILTLLVLAIGFTVYMNIAGGRSDTAEVGKKAPDFVLKDLDGHEYRLSDYRGKGVFLNFWGTYCEPCKDEMPAMDRQYQIYKDQGVEILAVNVGEAELAIEKFINEYDLTFPVIVDESGDVQRAYGIFPLPATYLINSDGIIVDYITGRMDEADIQEYMERIKP